MLQVWGRSASEERNTGCILKESACDCLRDIFKALICYNLLKLNGSPQGYLFKMRMAACWLFGLTC